MMKMSDSRHNVILSTAAFPPVEYFVYMAAAKEIWLEADENFNKQTYRNRFIINSANGPLTQIIPVKRFHYKKTPITQVGVDHESEWQRLSWRAIFAAYSNSPYFLFFKDDLIPFFREQWDNLFEYNLSVTMHIMKLIGLDKPLKINRDFVKNYTRATDKRYDIHPKKSLTMEMQPWPQVFEARHGFNARVSILDLLFNKGPESLIYLNTMATRDILF